MKYRQLGKTGERISILAFGCSPLGDVFGDTAERERTKSVHAAIDGGINYFDVAPLYGLTLAEERLGKALEGKRNSVFLATKCCRDTFDATDYSAARVKQSIEESLTRLKSDHVDLLQIHDVEFADRKQILEETIPAAREVQESGKARFIGITGLPVRYLTLLAKSADVDTILSWGHFNLLEDEMEEELTPLCIEKEIGLINASPLHQRVLTETGAPVWHRSPPPVLAAAVKIAGLCRKHGVDVADVAMKYALDNPNVATTIVGMSKLRHVESNLRALDLTIPDGLLPKIERMAEPVKNMMWYEGLPENNIPPSDPARYVPQTPAHTHSSENGDRR